MVKINGKEYPFKLSLGAIKDYEKEFNKSFNKAVVDGLDVTEMTYLAFEGIKAGHKSGKNSEEQLDLEMSDLDGLGYKDLNEIAKLILSEMGVEDVDPKK